LAGRFLDRARNTGFRRGPFPGQSGMRNAEVIRQWQVLREIEARRTGVTIHELSAQVGVSTRTIRRDLQALQEAGFAVFDEGADNETKRWKLDTAPFRAVQEGLSVADVAALYLSRAVVEGLSGWPLADELRSAFGKLERALNPRMQQFLSTLPEVLSAKAGPRVNAASTRQVDITRRLFEAARDRRVVEMRYHSAASASTKAYTIHPYRLALAHGGLYLVGWVPAYDAFRTFATERIERLSVTDEVFKATRQLPASVFANSMGVFSGDPEPVELEFTAHAALFARSRIWHESQHVEDVHDGRMRMTLTVSNDRALRNWILGFGASVRVVSPTTLARDIVTECRQLLASYDEPR
jgi:predicted DNA-binding transcriptional regulator YafY